MVVGCYGAQGMNILDVSNLSKSFGEAKVINDISFSVKRGEIVGFVGPNGAGKTTTLRLITDLIRPDKGAIVIDGYPLKTQREMALKSLSGIIENPGLYLNLSGLDNMLFIAELGEYRRAALIGQLNLQVSATVFTGRFANTPSV